MRSLYVLSFNPIIQMRYCLQCLGLEDSRDIDDSDNDDDAR